MIGWPFDDVERRGVAQKTYRKKDRKRKVERKKKEIKKIKMPR